MFSWADIPFKLCFTKTKKMMNSSQKLIKIFSIHFLYFWLHLNIYENLIKILTLIWITFVGARWSHPFLS